MRDWIFAIVLLVACVLVAVGFGLWSVAAGLIVAGVLLAGWAFVVFVIGEAGAPTPAPADDGIPEPVL